MQEARGLERSCPPPAGNSTDPSPPAYARPLPPPFFPPISFPPTAFPPTSFSPTSFHPASTTPPHPGTSHPLPSTPLARLSRSWLLELQPALAVLAMMDLAVSVQTMVMLTAWLALGVLAMRVLALGVLALGVLACLLFLLCPLLLMTSMPGRM